MTKAENVMAIVVMAVIILVIAYEIANPSSPQDEAQRCVDRGGTPLAVYSHVKRRTEVMCVSPNKDKEGAP